MMMDRAERHGELVADFETHASRLGKAHVVRMGGLAPTDHAGLPGNVLQVLLRPDPLLTSAMASVLLSTLTRGSGTPRPLGSPVASFSGTRARAHAFRCPTSPFATSEVSCAAGRWVRQPGPPAKAPLGGH